MSTCNRRLDLQTPGSQPVMPKISTISASEWMIFYVSPLLDAVLLQQEVVLSNITSSPPVLSVVHFEHCEGVLSTVVASARSFCLQQHTGVLCCIYLHIHHVA